MSNIIYKNGTVYQVSHDEGRTVNNVFEYDIKDHLGSLRVSFKDSVGIAKVTQESHTGVFGDVLPSLVYTNTPKTDNFDYTGHERLKAFNLGYIDAGARWMDPILGRFVQIDQLAETSRRWSPYTYAFNSPLMFIDPDGMENTGLPEQQPQNNGFEYSDGYQTHNSYENTGAVSFEGSYQNTGGDDKPKATPPPKQSYFSKLAHIFVKSSQEAWERAKASLMNPTNWKNSFELATLLATGGEGELVESAAVKSSELVIAEGGLTFNKGVLENLSKHAFAGGRHADLGMSVEVMSAKGIKLIEQNVSLLKAGDNTLIGNINGIEKSFKVFVQNGKIMSINMYPGVSNRATTGTLINLGEIKW